MNETPNLALPYIAAAQAQKHVTHNEAIRSLDAIVQLCVLDLDLSSPPISPNDGDRYIVAPAASGVWSGKEVQIAAFQDNAWVFFTPLEGWLAYVADDDKLMVFDGVAWNEVSGSGGGSVNPTALVGINTTASNPDKLAVKSDTVLFSHDDVTPGTGDIQVKLSKALSTNTAAFLFQDNFSGRAEIGLTGDDDFHFKVSANGIDWQDAIIIDDASGAVSLPQTALNNNLLINGDYNINQRAFAGGALAAGVYGYDRWKAGAAGADCSVDGSGVMTLNSGELTQIIETAGVNGQAISLSVDNLAGGDLDIDVEGVGGTISAGSGRKNARIVIPSGSTGNLTVILSPASGVVTFSRVKLELGSYASAWYPVDRAVELQRALRYFYRLDIAGFAEMFTGRAHAAMDMRALINLPALMRTAPGVSWGGAFTNWAVNSGGSFSFVSAVSLWKATKDSVTLKLTTASLPFNRAVAIRQGGSSTSNIDFDAEL